MSATLNEVVQFLLGAGELNGCYFGDIPEGEKGAFWWRKHLREAYASAQDTGFMDLRRIRAEVAEYYRLSPDALANSGRSKGLATARQMAYLLCRSLTPCSTPEIGDAFCRDHSTVVVGIETMRKRVNKDRELRKQFDELKNRLESRP